MKTKIVKNRIGIALFLLVSLLIVAPAIAQELPNRVPSVPTASADAPNYPSLSTFTPISPCRAVDTRYASKWGYSPLYAGQTRDVWLWALDGDQGGSATDCVPAAAQAVAIVLSAVPQSGQGFMTVWRYGDPRPLASSVNYSSLINQRAIANGVVVPMCPDCGNELSVYNNPGTSHFIIDVTGYWMP